MSDQGAFVQLPVSLLTDKNVSAGALRVYCAIKNMVSRQRGYCWATNEQIGAVVDLKARQVARLLPELGAYLIIDNPTSKARQIRLGSGTPADTNHVKSDMVKQVKSDVDSKTNHVKKGRQPRQKRPSINTDINTDTNTVTNVTVPEVAKKVDPFHQWAIDIMDIFIGHLGVGLPGGQKQYFAAKRLVKRYGVEKVANASRTALEVQGHDRFAPQITSPVDLEQKMGKLVVYMQRQNTINEDIPV